MVHGNRMSRAIGAVLLSAVLFVSACDKDALEPPTATAVSENVRDMFTRYVALGNSITAGFQSLGINNATQVAAYPVLLAEQMGLRVGEDWNAPLLNPPGCPPPVTNIFTQARLGGFPADFCAARLAPVPEFINNVAVPGAEAMDPTNNLSPNSNPNPLTTFILGGRTQVEVAQEMKATFVTVWIGSGDALDVVTDLTNAGDPSLITTPTDFTARYGAMLDGLDAIQELRGGVLMGAVQVGLAPYVTQGRAWKAFELQFDQLTAPLNAFDVNNNCMAFQAVSTTDTIWASVPFHLGAPLLAVANANIAAVQAGTLPPQDLVPVQLDCSVANAITVAEGVALAGAVAQYNAFIAAEAAERDWIYLDPNTILIDYARRDPTAVRPFPAFNSADPQHATAPFGWLLSLDGLHPSSAAHEIIANELITAINDKYGAGIPEIP